MPPDKPATTRPMNYRRQKIDIPLWTLSSVRFQIVLMLGGSMTVIGMLRASLSMAIINMVKTVAETSDEFDNSTDFSTTESPSYPDRDFFLMDWSVEQQARIHTSYYVGALIAVFTADKLCKKFGAKNVMSLAILMDALCSILTPVILIPLRHYSFMIAIRTIMGFGSGFSIPTGSVMISKWFPISEKSTAMAIFTTGNQVGIAVSMLLTAKLCQIPFMGGWPIAFVLYGVIGLAFLIVWHVRAAEKPRNSKYITASELEYIMGARARARANTILMPTPYMKIVLNPCVIAICCCSFAQSFVLVGLITYLPRYNQIAMQMSITENGIWSAVPFFVQMVTKLLFALIADSLKKREISATIVTKAWNAVASFGTATCILIISLLGPAQSLFVMLLMCLSMGLFSGYVPGYNTSIVSVAPQFTAFISSYAQIYSQCASTLAPFLLGIMTTKGDVEEWKWVFYMLAGVLIVSGLIFQIIGHGRTERWGDVPSVRSSFNMQSFSSETGINKQHSIAELNKSLLEDVKKLPKKKTSRISYRDDDTFSPMPTRMEDLENDCIVEEDELQ